MLHNPAQSSSDNIPRWYWRQEGEDTKMKGGKETGGEQRLAPKGGVGPTSEVQLPQALLAHYVPK